MAGEDDVVTRARNAAPIIRLKRASRAGLVGVALALATGGIGSVAASTARDGAAGESATPAAARQQLGEAAVPFVPNAGQWDAQAAFGARTLAGTLFVTTDGRLVYRVPGQVPPRVRAGGRRGGGGGPGSEGAAGPEAASPPSPGWSLIESFVDAQGRPLAAPPRGAQPSSARVSYFTGGDATRHRSGIGTFDRVDLGEVFPGVAVQLRATGSNVEKVFTVAPMRDPQQIRVRIDGATRIEVGGAGELIAHTGNGPITYTAPIAYQEDAAGIRTLVEVRYELPAPNAQTTRKAIGTASIDDSTTTNATPASYAFAVGPYDRARALTIDPLLQSTYLGGSGSDEIFALLVHPATGDIYVAGSTASTPFPGTTGGADTTFGGQEAFVSRFSSDLTRLLQSTYLGGSADGLGDETAAALAAHPASGDVYVAGFTTSADFPGVAGGAQPAYGGGFHDAFVSRLSSDLTVLRQSTYLGGNDEDVGRALAIHPVTGEVYVGGYTASATGFPRIAGGARSTIGGGTDGFVSRLNSTLTAVLQSTYLGGTDTDLVHALAIHPASGDVYAAGQSISANFPGTTGGAQSTLAGNSDGFVSRLDRTLTSLLRSTYLGGSGNDYIQAMAVHPATGEVYVAGDTTSTAGSFPVSPPFGAQRTFAGIRDGFVSRLDPGLKAINMFTYFGGSGADFLTAMIVHPQTGEIYVAGHTSSPALPGVTGGVQAAAGGEQDAYAGRLTADLSTIVQSTFLGADNVERGNAIAIHPATGEVYVAGQTFPGGFAFPGIAGGAQPANGGSYDGFVSRLSPDLTAINTTPNRFAFLAQSNVPPNTLRTSNEVRIAGIPGSGYTLAYVTGQPGSQLCDTDRPGCCAEPTPMPYCSDAFLTGWVASFGQVFDGDYFQVRHTSQNPVGNAETHLIIGGVATTFRSSTGNAAFACNLDMDGDNKLDALTEGLVLIRAMFGLTGTAVTQGTTVTTPWSELSRIINAGCGTKF